MRRGVSRDGNAPGDAISAAVVLDEQLHERVEAAGAEPMSGWVGRLALGALTIGAATWIAPTRGDPGDASAVTLPPESAAQAGYAYYPYDGSVRFIRIQTSSGGRGRFGGFRGGWAHDYPASDLNLSTILRELSYIRTRELPMGGNVLTFDDPRLMQFPIAYVSEPGGWRVSEAAAAGLREYLLKGGFVMFDDFFAYEMDNVFAQMGYIFPELQWVRLDGTEEVWESFYSLDALEIYLEGPRKYGTPEFWGLFEENDKGKRMMAIANAGADVGDLWEWAAEGWYPVDPTNEAFRLGMNYFIYALTH